jgi:hypothetical protein
LDCEILRWHIGIRPLRRKQIVTACVGAHASAIQLRQTCEQLRHVVGLAGDRAYQSGLAMLASKIAFGDA